LTTGRAAFFFTLPLVYQDSPWISFTAAGSIPSGGAQHGAVQDRGRGPGGRRDRISLAEEESFNQYGLADPNVGAEVIVYESLFGSEIALVSTVKLPVTSLESGFGTGEWDAGIGISSTFRIGDRYLFGDLAYWSFGDMPDLELNAALSYTFSIGQPFRADRYGVIVTVGGMTRVISGVTPPAYVAVGLARFGLKRDVSLKAGVGLTESSPDFSFSLGWSLPLWN
jgi:hypothetical protein